MGSAHVTRRGAARWQRGHPWIYRSDVVGPPGVEAGVVRVLEESGALVGTALWSPASLISLRMLAREELAITAAFWAERMDAALEYRASLGLPARAAAPVSAYRLVHAEADGMPSLVVDRYGEFLVVQFLSAGLEACRADIIEALLDRLSPAGILARNDVPVRHHEGLPRAVELLWGEVPQEVEVMEGDVVYQAEPWTGQKTGAFLDQRENRLRAAELGRGRVLDCFTFQGAFALQLAHRAAEVVAVDSSAPALARAASNVRRNGLQNVRLVEANVFDFLRAEEAAGAEYDVVVLDPPAFAKRRQALERALAGYKEINLRAMRLLAPGGHLCTFSCSYAVDAARFRAMLLAAAEDAGRPLRWVESRGQAQDHPEVLQIPETGYLKGAILQAV